VAPMPRWMFAGPASPLQPSFEPPPGAWTNAPRGSGQWNPPPGFNLTPGEQLPQLPRGLAWVRVEHLGQAQWEPMSLYGPNRQPLELTWYDVPTNPAGNYIIRTSGGTVIWRQAFRPAASAYGPGLPANTGAGGIPLPGAPRSGRGNFPMTTADFVEPVTGRANVRGHGIDYRNTTPRTATIPDSNLDPANFAPEPDWWGSGPGRGFEGRVQLTNRIARANPAGGDQLLQYADYGPSPRTTVNGTPIPDHVILVEATPAGVPTRAWRVPFNPAAPPPALTRAGLIDTTFGIPLNQVPQPILNDLPAAAQLAGAGAAAGTETRQ
jgi:hypothetical protein